MSNSFDQFSYYITTTTSLNYSIYQIEDEVCNMFDSAVRIGKKEEGQNRQNIAHCLCKDLRNTLIKKGKGKGRKDKI